jgi:hypothetical protein
MYDHADRQGHVRKSLLWKLGWLDLEGKRCVHTATTVWNLLHLAEAPEQLAATFESASERLSMATRSADTGGLQQHATNSSQALRSFCHHAVNVWNHNDIVPPAARMAKTALGCRNLVYNQLLKQMEQRARDKVEAARRKKKKKRYFNFNFNLFLFQLASEGPAGVRPSIILSAMDELVFASGLLAVM